MIQIPTYKVEDGELDQIASIVDSVGPVDCSVLEAPGSKPVQPLVNLGLKKRGAL